MKKEGQLKLWGMITSTVLLLCWISGAAWAWSFKEAAAPYRGKTLNILTWKHASTDAWVRTGMVKEFEKETGIKVDITVFPFGVLHEKIAFEMASKSKVWDCIHIAVINSKEYEAGGYVQPLEPFILNKKLTAPDFDLSDFYPGFLGDMQGMANKWTGDPIKGKPDDNILYGLPHVSDTMLLAYRPEILKKAGYDRPPGSYGELLEYAKKVHMLEPGVSALAMRGKRGQGEQIWLYSSLYLAWGGKWADENWNWQINSQENLDALTYWCELKKYNIRGLPGWAEIEQAVLQGKTAMSVCSTNFPASFENPKKSRVKGKMRYDAMPYNENTKLSIAPHAAHGLALSAFSQQPEMGWLFMQWVTRPDQHLKNNTVGRQGSAVLKSVANHPEYVKAYGWTGYIRGTEWGYSHTPPDYRPCIPEWRNVGDEFGVAVEEAESGIRSPKKALDWANKRATEIIAQAGYYKAKKKYPWKAWPYADMKVSDEDLKKNWVPFK